ncbi:hypothetical protein CGCFRS4_v014445 [Colletotrichum fructicola]|nr:hypothetical protein CGCFRS4_v014445 [Colletotrichum fructicola]
MSSGQQRSETTSIAQSATTLQVPAEASSSAALPSHRPWQPALHVTSCIASRFTLSMSLLDLFLPTAQPSPPYLTSHLSLANAGLFKRLPTDITRPETGLALLDCFFPPALRLAPQRRSESGQFYAESASWFLPVAIYFQWLGVQDSFSVEQQTFALAPQPQESRKITSASWLS